MKTSIIWLQSYFTLDATPALWTKLIPHRLTMAGLEISQLCPAQISQSTCNGGNLPGMWLFSYIDTRCDIIIPEYLFWVLFTKKLTII